MNSEDLDRLPTRHPRSTGHANERQMDARVVDNHSCTTVIRKHPDGSETMLRTRGGNLHYSTTKPKTEESVPIVYLESGAQTQLNEPEGASVWQTLGLAAKSKDYMAGVWSDGPSMGKHANGEVTDNNSSKAMIETERKPVAEQFPPSLFSGTMRLFIQAQYGAKDRTELDVIEEEDYTCSFDAINTLYGFGGYTGHIKSVYRRDGSNTPAPHRRLRYTDADNSNQEIVLGVNVTESCGIFRSKRKFWVITIENYAGECLVTAYPLSFPAKLRAMLRRIDKVTKPVEQTAETRLEARRLMAYAFAYAKIDTAKAVVLSSTLACGEGPTLCYGFKWNRDGTEAKLITHTTESPGGTNYEWNSYETTISISYTDNPYFATEAEKFSITSEVEDHGRWTNREESLIYAPVSESVDREADDKFRLHNINLGTSSFSTGHSCADLPIYGFYIDDEWTPVLFTNEMRNADKEFWTEQSSVCSGYWSKDPDGTPPYSPAGFYEYNGAQFVVDATWRIPWGVYYSQGSGFSIMQKMEYIYGILLKFGLGENDVHTVIGDGIGKRRELVVSPGSSATTVPVYGYWSPEIEDLHGHGLEFFENSSEVQSFMAQCTDEYWSPGDPDLALVDFGYEHHIAQLANPSGTYRTYSRPEGSYDKVALIIPHGDCEAVFMATGEDGWILDWEGNYSSSDPPLVTSAEWRFWKYYHRISTNEFFYVYPGGCPNPTANYWTYTAFPTLTAMGTEDPGATRAISLESPTADVPVTPPSVFDEFWKPDSLFYMDGMYALSAMGGKYVTSQGSTEAALNYSDRFCGWV